MIAASQVVELFDGTGPGQGRDMYVGGGGYPEQVAGARGSRVYYAGGSGTLEELNQAAQSAGPMGMAQAGGYRKNRRKSRKHRKSRRRGSTGRRQRNYPPSK